MPTETLDAAIGRTPLVRLRGPTVPDGVRLYAKVEGQNPSGSIKDRIARALLDAAEAQGRLHPGDTLVEASTGNTAIALALLAKQRGYHLRVVMPEGVVSAIPDLLGFLGVEITWTRPKAGMLGAIEEALAIGARPGHLAVRQFDDPLNCRTHYETTGPELLAALPRIDALVAGIGTGGTLMGTGRRLREANPDVKLVGVEPRTGEHLQGLRSLDEGFRPPLVDLDLLDGRYLVSAAKALVAAREIARSDGILAGVSAGAALHAALQYARRLKEGNIVVIFADAGWKYLPSRPWDAAAAGEVRLDETHWW